MGRDSVWRIYLASGRTKLWHWHKFANSFAEIVWWRSSIVSRKKGIFLNFPLFDVIFFTFGQNKCDSRRESWSNHRWFDSVFYPIIDFMWLAILLRNSLCRLFQSYSDSSSDAHPNEIFRGFIAARHRLVWRCCGQNQFFDPNHRVGHHLIQHINAPQKLLGVACAANSLKRIFDMRNNDNWARSFFIILEILKRSSRVWRKMLVTFWICWFRL